MNLDYLTPEYKENLRLKALEKSYKKHRYGYRLKLKLDGYKERALQKKQVWALTDDQALDYFVSDCTYCGRESEWDLRKMPAGAKVKPNGIDRIANKLGYVSGNCVACCYTCNVAKNDMTVEDFKSWIKRVYEKTS